MYKTSDILQYSGLSLVVSSMDSFVLESGQYKHKK